MEFYRRIKIFPLHAGTDIIKKECPKNFGLLNIIYTNIVRRSNRHMDIREQITDIAFYRIPNE